MQLCTISHIGEGGGTNKNQKQNFSVNTGMMGDEQGRGTHDFILAKPVQENYVKTSWRTKMLLRGRIFIRAIDKR